MARDSQELLKKLQRAHELVQVGAQYRHRDGALYRVERILMREEDLEPAVHYEAVDGAPIPWDRKISVFLERFRRVDLPWPSPVDDPISKG